MFNLILLFFGVAAAFLPFLDNVLLRRHHKEQLQQRFQKWWDSVKHQDKLDFAVSCAGLADRWLDRFFGPKVFWSLRVWRRSLIISSSLLITTLSFVGISNKEPFWFTPWNNYNKSVRLLTNAVNVLFSEESVQHLYQLNYTNSFPGFNQTNTAVIRYNTNLFLLSIQNDILLHVTNIIPINHGGITVEYVRIAHSDTNAATNNTPLKEQLESSIQELRKGAYSMRDYAIKHSTPTNVAVYSVMYFAVLFSVNVLLFVVSLAACRITLREIVAAKRVIATISLIVSNLTAVLIISSIVLFCFTVFAIPLMWLYVMYLYRWSEESIYTTLMYCAGSTLALWISSGTSPKLIALIAFVPSFLAVAVSGFSVFALKWKRAFHGFVGGVVVRLTENNPIMIITVTVLFVSAILTIIVKLLHITAFL